MNHLHKKFLLVIASFSCATHLLADNSALPYFSIRSQGDNLAREQVGWQQQQYLFEAEGTNGAFYIAPHYAQTWNSQDIARCIFGSDIKCNDCAATINVSGSCVENRGSHDWLADYFGLPVDFKSTLRFKPRIRNFIVDLGVYLGLDGITQGLYIKLYAPITHTRWDFGFSECNIEPGIAAYQEGYFSDKTDGNPASDLLERASDFLTGQKAPKILNEDERLITFNKLECCAFPTECGGCDNTNDKNLVDTRLADIELILGYTAWQTEDYRFGFGVRMTAPTGSTPHGKILFEPIAGNGGHWTLGVALTGQGNLWCSDNEEKHFDVYVDANIAHLFSTCQTRCFDLCDKPNSRYMLALRLKDNDEGLKGENSDEDASHIFANEFTPVANITKSCVDVSASVQGELAVTFSYTCDKMNFDFGYNFYGRSCEDIDRKCGQCETNQLDGKTWALKGDAHVYGFANDEGTPIPYALSATNSAATIHGGSNRTIGDNPCQDPDNLINPRIDKPEIAKGPNSEDIHHNTSFTDYTNTSIQPVGIKACDLDLRGTKIITHKIYAHWGYTWSDHENVKPFLGLGAEIEFSSDDDCCEDPCKTPCKTKCDTKCDDCKKCGVNQWGIWLKGGVAFD